MPPYPGLGLPLRHDDHHGEFYPIGAHRNNPSSSSALLFVRELAMMNIMEKITDKPDWKKKVFDEEIAKRWEEEALEVRDGEWMGLAVGAKGTWYDQQNGGNVVLEDDMWPGERRMLEGIINREAFGFVSIFLRVSVGLDRIGVEWSGVRGE